MLFNVPMETPTIHESCSHKHWVDIHRTCFQSNNWATSIHMHCLHDWNCIVYYHCSGCALFCNEYLGYALREIKTSYIIKYNITLPSTGKWSSPLTTGPRPPPCNFFSLTAINDHEAVLFGGRRPYGRVSDCYLMDFESMVCPRGLCINFASLQLMSLWMWIHTQWME